MIRIFIVYDYAKIVKNEGEGTKIDSPFHLKGCLHDIIPRGIISNRHKEFDVVVIGYCRERK